MNHTHACPHECPLCDTRLINKGAGLTPEKAIQLLCQLCTMICYDIDGRDMTVHCLTCDKKFPYQFIKGTWYKYGNQVKDVACYTGKVNEWWKFLE